MPREFQVDVFWNALQQSSFQPAAARQDDPVPSAGGAPPQDVPPLPAPRTHDADVDWPLLTRIRVAWRALLAGEGDAATLRGLLVQARFEVEKKEQMLADSLGTSHDPDPLQQALQEAMHAQTETVARLQGLPGAGQETVEAALQEAQEAANRLDTLLRQGEECQEALIVVTCPRCGVRCADDATRCACCGSIIPSLQP